MHDDARARERCGIIESMELTKHEDAGSFVEALRPLWEPREAELNLMLGVACAIRDGRWRPPSAPLLASLERDGEPIAAVLRTPPSGFIVAEGAPGGAAELARALARSGDDRFAPAVIASSAAARDFGRAWSRETGAVATLTMAQRILALTEVVPPRAAHGASRLAKLDDADTLTDWFGALETEATPDRPTPRDELVAMTRRRIESGNVLVWETENGLASVASLARPTPNGVAVNGVYTPPEQRGRGYASCCVAAITQRALDSGKRFTCLYTDASNPTSNAIYERLGYCLVCESEYWSLGVS